LPDQITIDVTALEINKAIHVGEITPPAGVEILGDKHIAVVSVAAPRTEEVAVVADAAAPAAGDVEMTKEKKDEDGAAPAKGAATAKGDVKAVAGDKKVEAKPEAKAEKKK
jgi:hypothetical protein